VETTTTRSFEKFNYLLRPSKQVERKLILQGLLALMRDGVAVDAYTYLGFGSPFYADFVMLHKTTGIEDMYCVEAQPVERRMRFNMPYGLVKLRMGTLSETLPDLPRNRRYLAWFDYDYVLNASVLEDLAGMLRIAAPGSIIVVTVEAEARLPDRQLNKELSRLEREVAALRIFRDELSRPLGRRVEAKDLASRELPKVFAQVMRNYLKDHLAATGEMEFLQLFNTYYADGAQMLTFGGMITPRAEMARLRASSHRKAKGINSGRDPIWIGVPPLTLREKLWLDQRIRGRRRVDGRTIDLPQAFVKTYRKYYREYPLYSEVWL
jgi:hypothetical protein